jgi:DNA-binding CsgD family transcriptional regulator
MLGSTSIPPVPHGIKNLMTGLSSIAGRWGSSLIAYEIHPNLEGVEIGPMVYGTEIVGAQFANQFNEETDLATEMQWRRMTQERVARFDGPLLRRDGENLALQYVLKAIAASPLLLLVALPLDASKAAGCSTELDAMLGSVNLSSVGTKVGVLNRRELEVVKWISEGKTSHEAALILGLSEHTINEYIRSGMKKMGATNRLNFVAKTIRLGLVA